MILKLSFNVIKGMRLDTSPSKANPEYIFDARNIRLTARGNDTLLSISNEQDSKSIYAASSTIGLTIDLIKGKVLGYCVLNNYLVTFSTDKLYSGNTIDYITRVYKSNNGWVSDILYSSHSTVEGVLKETSGRLNFGDTILTLGIYENENILKVYWVDGVNLPRVINITKDYLENKTVEEIAANYTNTSFDFVPELLLNETIDVRTILGGNGRFSAGTILYAFTYYNKYGLESNIFYTTDLYYITHSDRGGSPEDLINTSFKISIKDVDYLHFDYIRIYSIHRTSIDAVPEVKKVIELPTTSLELPSESLTKISEAFYIKVKMSSTIEVNGKPLSDYLDYILYTEFEHGYYKGNYYVFTKSDFYNLTIKVEDKIIKHGETNNAIYIAVNSSGYPMPEGRLICADEAETSKISIYSSKIIGNEDIVFVDTNTTGESVDPTFLLYVGGEDIIANTLNLKDNTLFLGNITLTKPSIPDSIKTLLLPTYDEEHTEWNNKIITVNQNTRSVLTDGLIGSHYAYTNLLIDGNSTTFKIGEHYRLGLLFLYKNGKWSEPLPINYAYTVLPKDKTTSKDCRPSIRINEDNIEYSLPYLYINLSTSILLTLIDFGFKRTRAVIVNPSLQDRKVILQGMVCPTVYTNYNRDSDKLGDIYALSSWFFRPFHSGNNNALEYKESNAGGYLAYSHNSSINGIRQSFGELDAEEDLTNITATEIEYIGNYYATDNIKNFKVDLTFLNLYSPDIEFDTYILLLDSLTFYFKKVGRVDFDASVGDISIETSSPTIGERAKGFDHKTTTFIRSTDNPNISAKSLLSNYFYIDYMVDEIKGESRFEPVTGYGATKFLVCPWQSSGSLNNDINRPANAGARSAVLKRKVISNLKVSFDNTWRDFTNSIYENVQIGVFNSDEVTLLRYKGKNYLGNIDTLLTYELEYSKIVTNIIKDGKYVTTTVNQAFAWIGDEYKNLGKYVPSIRMKYKTAPHIVFLLNNALTADNVTTVPHLYLMDICRSTVANAFGGTSDAALKANLWIPSGLSVKLDSKKETTVNFLHGDCWYLRYDCLKTYPYTQEDENSIVEIGSFMVETRVNIDGRYDRNRGLLSNLNITPLNFNLLNNVYSLKDNFFNYRILDKDLYKLNTFSNTITWSKEKMSSEETDTWTNITMANTFDMDGNLGLILSIENYNNELYCFLDKGISNILFNNRVLIPTSDNVPIEISNGYKVLGKRYLSNSIGSQNLKSILATPNGIYFLDLYNSGIYLLNQLGILDISTPRGFTNWVKDYLPSRTYYDANNGDVYFISDLLEYNLLDYRKCLCFSEKLNEFTSFMDYFTNDFMFNIQNNFYSLSRYVVYHGSGTKFKLMFAGDYMNNYHITYIANQNPTNDKIFNTLEFRADTLLNDLDSLIIGNNPLLPNKCPFNKLTVWNEYQLGESSLTNIFGKPSSLKQKFRIWRVNIPRDKSNNRDRIRNPWTYIKLEGSNNTNRMLLHDLLVYYFDNSIVSLR